MITNQKYKVKLAIERKQRVENSGSENIVKTTTAMMCRVKKRTLCKSKRSEQA